MLLPELRSNMYNELYIYIFRNIYTLGGFQRDASGADTGCRTTSLPTKSSPSDGVAARASALQPTHLHFFRQRNKKSVRRPGPILAILLVGEQSRGGAPTLRQTCPRPKPRAQGAFKTSMVHGILQFTRRIAFRCVLHRYGSQDIRC